MEAREKRCRDLPAQGLLNSLGAVVARGGGRRLGEQGGLGLGFLLPGSGLKSRNHDLHVSNLVGRDQGCRVVGEAGRGNLWHFPRKCFLSPLGSFNFFILFIFSY